MTLKKQKIEAEVSVLSSDKPFSLFWPYFCEYLVKSATNVFSEEWSTIKFGRWFFYYTKPENESESFPEMLMNPPNPILVLMSLSIPIS